SSAFGTSPLLITDISFRPTSRAGTPFDTILNLQVDLSTTAAGPNTLSRVFADNLGRDDTVLHSGSIRLKSDFSGPVEGPKAFDVTIHFDHPFFYDPSLGNLLLDIRNFSRSFTSFMDFELEELASGVMGRAGTIGSFVQSPFADFVRRDEGLVTRFTTES